MLILETENQINPPFSIRDYTKPSHVRHFDYCNIRQPLRYLNIIIELYCCHLIFIHPDHFPSAIPTSGRLFLYCSNRKKENAYCP